MRSPVRQRSRRGRQRPSDARDLRVDFAVGSQPPAQGRSAGGRNPSSLPRQLPARSAPIAGRVVMSTGGRVASCGFSRARSRSRRRALAVSATIDPASARAPRYAACCSRGVRCRHIVRQLEDRARDPYANRIAALPGATQTCRFRCRRPRPRQTLDIADEAARFQFFAYRSAPSPRPGAASRASAQRSIGGIAMGMLTIAMVTIIVEEVLA